MTTSIITGDCRDVLPTLDAGSVQCVVTSPPYFGLRDYGVDGQIGLESTVEAFVAEMVAVFREVRRVLKDDGTLWLNLGDSYANDGKWGGSSGGKHVKALHGDTGIGRQKVSTGLKPKDLIGIPWRVAFALQADGWYLRQDIIWAKPNPMPESVTDRCTKSHEYLFLLTKSPRYYFDAKAIAEPHAYDWTANAAAMHKQNHERRARIDDAGGGITGSGGRDRQYINGPNPAGRNKRSVWTIATQPFPDAHFATFPEKLVEPCILAGTSERGECRECGKPWVRVVERTEPSYWEQRKAHDYTGRKADAAPNDNYKSVSNGRPENSGVGYSSMVTTGWEPSCSCDAGRPIPQTILDPFAGSGTTVGVANRLGRHGVAIELNPDYVPMIEKRTAQQALEMGVA